ncbi:MAG TPA: ferredoxin [Acidimicrobiales bacterium]|jgi:ferredoxin|nr:ferredoxin [Acidimicrobiales bacterium]
MTAESDRASRRIIVDRDRCIGSGNCSFYAPNTFDLDEELKSVVVDPAGDDPSDVRAAVEGCPVNAIRIEADDEET